VDVPPDLPDLRVDYQRSGLVEADLAGTWLEQFRAWFAQAHAVTEPNAVVLGTATPDGIPSARTVLLKGVDERGFSVFTNLTSRKGREVRDNPHASLVFPWYELERQVVVAGTVSLVERDEVEAYFRSRPRSSQIGAWASRQSQPVSRAVLEGRMAALETEWDGAAVPVPEFWGGLRIAPTTVEFWQGRSSRLHDRLSYDVASGVVTRLSP
jgi:pyridoxamine 5'-phosphate oxidase